MSARATRSRALAAAACLGLALSALSACGGTSEDSGKKATDEERAACVKEATSIVEAARKPLEVKGPPTDLDMGSLANKEVWLISAGQTEFTQTVGDGFADAAEAAGLKSKYVQADFQVNKMQQLVEQAVSAKVAGIALLNVEPGAVSGPLKKATDQGTAVIDLNNGDPDAELEPGIFAHVAATFTEDGKHKAAWALMDSGCDMHMATFTVPTLNVIKLMIDSATATVEDMCSDCKVVGNEFSLADFSTKLGPQAQTVVRRDPKIKYVDAAADAFAGVVSPVLGQSNPDVKILGHDGSPSTLESMAAGNTQQAMTIAGPPEKYIGWALVDQLGRALLDQDAADWSLPGRIIDETNIGDGSEASIHPDFEGFEDLFTEKWGV